MNQVLNKNIVDKVRTFAESNGLFDYDSTVIVGLSGGPDSVALLAILHQLHLNCIAAHCNFHLRGEESDRDMHYVEDLTSRLSVPLEIVHFQTTEYAEENHISIEMAARELRYRWFEQIRIKHSAKAIAIAHHSDDVIETFFINLLRGSGLHGLTGIKPKNGVVIRPLLCLSRQDILNFLQEENLQFVIDSSNNSNDYLRNKIRNVVVPDLVGAVPSAKRTILKTISNLRQSEVFESSQIDFWKEKVLSVKNKCVYISLRELYDSENRPLILFELLRPYNATSEIVANILRCSLDSSGEVFFTHGFQILKNRDQLEIKESEKTESASYVIDLKASILKIDIPIKMEFTVLNKIDVEIKKTKCYCYLDFDKVKLPLTIRHWNNGDFFYPFGQNQKKKVSDFFINEKMSLTEKQDCLLLTDCNDQILWVVGRRSDNRFKVTSSTQKVLYIAI